MNLIILETTFLVTFSMCSILALLNNESTYRRRLKVHEAIHNWAVVHGYDLQALDMYHLCESYEATFWRFWDHGIENILPKEYYDMLKEEGFL